MSRVEYDWFRKAVMALVCAFIVYSLLNLGGQSVFEAPYEARFFGLNPSQAELVERSVHAWEKGPGANEVRVVKIDGSAGDTKSLDVALRVEAAGVDYGEIGEFVAYVKPETFTGAFSVSREPSSLARSLALIASVFFFLFSMRGVFSAGLVRLKPQA